VSECPNDPAYCQCVEHHQGLRAHAADKAAFDRALSMVRGSTTLRVVAGLGFYEERPTHCRHVDAYLCDVDGCLKHPAPAKKWRAPTRLPDPPSTRALPERKAA
jgi:hypothetical protein